MYVYSKNTHYVNKIVSIIQKCRIFKTLFKQINSIINLTWAWHSSAPACFLTCFANISGYKAFFHNFFQQEWPWDRAGRFAYHKPYELNKMGDKFFMDFSFFAHRFFTENLWNFFLQMPDALGICGTMYKVKKEENLFWGELWLPSQNARTRVRILYLLEYYGWVLVDWSSWWKWSLQGKSPWLGPSSKRMETTLWKL